MGKANSIKNAGLLAVRRWNLWKTEMLAKLNLILERVGKLKIWISVHATN